MCRLLAYLGAPIIMNKLIFEPRNSLIHQSFDAREIEEPLNGDGFGVGWYVNELSSDPAVFVSMSPAWSNRNLRSIAPRIRAHSIFAHVRAASVGDISEANCHPFTSGRYMFMHNGSIGGFSRIKREVRRRLTDATYSWISGQTDSEHFFALVLDKLQGELNGVESMYKALNEAIKEVEAIKASLGITELSYINCALGDGERFIATRYISSAVDDPLSLYFSEGARYECNDGVCHMIRVDSADASVLVVSEKLTDFNEDWRPVPKNHAIIVGLGGAMELRPIG